MKFRLPLSIIRWFRFGGRTRKSDREAMRQHQAARKRQALLDSAMEQRLLSVRRRAFLTISAAAMVGASPALADTAFTTFAFPATGGTANRTMPARLADIANVKEYGVKGDGSTDDSAAIQSVFNNVLSGNGTVYFPAGTYIVNTSIGLGGATATITFTNGSANISWTANGLGLNAPVFFNTNGSLPSGFTPGQTYYVVTTGTNTIQVSATVGGGAITAGSAGSGTQTGNSPFSISLRIFGASAAGTIIKSNSGSLADYIFKLPTTNSSLACALTIEGIGFNNTNSSGGGCLMLESGLTPQIRNCDFNGFNCLSLSPTNSTTDQTTGAVISSCHFSCTSGTAASGSWGIFTGSVDTTIMGCTLLGFDHGIRMRGAGHAIIACQIESNNTGIMVGQDAQGVNAAAIACVIMGGSMENNGVSGIYVNSANFLKIEGWVITQGNTGPPAMGTTSAYGIQIVSGSKITVDTVQCNGAFATAGINITNVDTVSKVLFTNSDSGGTFTISGGTKKSNIQFINCVNAVDISTTFALLPGQASNSGEPPTHGERRLITDCTSATFNAAAAGTGATKTWVTYDLNRAAWFVG